MDVGITARGLKKTYSGGVVALDAVSFEVEKGTIFALVGPNGAGKTTTVRVLTTVSRPDAGAADVAGLDVLAEPGRVRGLIGVVGQGHGFDPFLTGWENMTMKGSLHGLRGSALKRRADAVLDRFGLSEAAGRVARGYSGGMQRRLDVAMGLIHSPQVLFLDEPTTGLDPEVRAVMWTEIARLVADGGITILLTTHYLEEADRLASELAIIDHGAVVLRGRPEALKRGLQGDTLHVDLSVGALPGQVEAILDRIGGLQEVVVDGRSVRARADDGASAVAAVIAALNEGGLGVASATIARPTLDDVYLSHTGHQLTETGSVGQDASA